MGKKDQRKQDNAGSTRDSHGRKFFIAALVVTGLLFLWAVILTMSRSAEVSAFGKQGWPEQYTEVMAKNKAAAVWHMFFMALLFSGYLWLQFYSKLKQNMKIWCSAALIAIVALDAYMLSKHYIQKLPGSYLEANNVTEVIKHNLGDQRLAMVTQDSFYNLWLTYLFPYHDIATFNYAQMPRMPDDLKGFMGTVGQNPLRMWQMSAVGILIGPANVEGQLLAMPELKGKVKQIFQYNVHQNPDGGVSVAPASMQYPGQHVVLKMGWTAPRYALLGGWQAVSDKQALAMLADPRYAIYEQVLFPEGVECTPLTGKGIVGDVIVKSFKPGHVELETKANSASILRCADRYNGDWKALVDGQEVPVLRADYIFQGVYLPAGNHTVELIFSPSKGLFYLQLGAVICCFGAVVFLLILRAGGRSKAVSHEEQCA